MGKQLHIVLLPLVAHGHMIPMLDMAKLFISKGLKATIISTPEFSDPIKRARNSRLDINLNILKFPPNGSDLPSHITSLDQMTLDIIPQFFKALSLLQEPFEELLREINPDAIVTDMFLHWTVDSAAKFGIPRLVFSGSSYIAACAREEMDRHKPYKNLSSDLDTFVIPDLPHELTFVRSQVFPFDLVGDKNGFTKLLVQVHESNLRSYGTVMNSFYEFESDYVDYYQNVLGRRAWPIGPLLLYNQGGVKENAQRGNRSAIDTDECLAWLDLKRPNSVVYMCFGSMATFTPSQLHETAIGLESSSQNFIWVVRQSGKNEDWLPDGFEERTKEKGLIIRGWAPQVMILDHKAIGAFVTHCGWNSTLEGICVGVPMVTWPVFAEQFINEKLIVEILRIGVSVGNKKWMRMDSEGVQSKDVANALKDIMLGEDADEIRNRAKNYKEMARKAIEEGGSSYNGLNQLIEELSDYCHPKDKIF